MTAEQTTAREQGVRRIPAGTVLAGRYRVDEEVVRVAGASVCEGEDVALAGRRVLVVVVPGDDRERTTNAWLEADTPWTAAVLDVVGLDGAVAGVFQLDSDAARLHQAGGASREQRAALLVDVARVLERTSDTQRAYRVVADGLLWVEGLPHDARLRAVPLPDVTADRDALRADDLAAFARLAGAQLFGLDAITPPAEAVAAMPPPIGPALAPLYADDPAARLAAGVSARALAAALGVTPAASRVPVPRAPAAPPDVRARVQAARTRVRQRFARELLAAVVLLIAGIVLGSQVRSVLTGAPSEAETPRSRQAGPSRPESVAVPTPADGSIPPSDVAMPVEQAGSPPARFFESLDMDGPVPRGLGAISADRRSRWRSHVRAFSDNEGRIFRAEFYEPGDLFTGAALFAWDDGATRPSKRADITSTGLARGSRTYDWEAGVFEARTLDGTPEIPGCPTVRFQVDDHDRFTSLACLNGAGEAADFPGGYHEERTEFPALDTPAARIRTVRFLDAAGEPAPGAGGYAQRRETRDMSGRVVEVQFLDADGRPTLDRDTGAAHVRYGWGARTSWTRYFGVGGQAVAARGGFHNEITYYDDLGGLRSRETLDIEGKPVGRDGTAIARVLFEVDERQRVASERYFGFDGTPVTNLSGVHEIRYARDAHDNVLRECHFSEWAAIQSVELGYAHCITMARDAHGRVVRQAYFGPDGRPVEDERTAVHRVDYRRDDLGRVVSASYFDRAGAADTLWSGQHEIRYSYGRDGAVTRLDYLNADGGLHEGLTGAASVVIENDARGRETRRCFLDASGAPGALGTGLAQGASCIATEWDDLGRVRWLRYADATGRPVAARFSDTLQAAALYFEYGQGDRLTRQEVLDASGNVVRELPCDLPMVCVGDSGWAWYVP